MVDLEGYIPVEHALRQFYHMIGDGPEKGVIPVMCWLTRARKLKPHKPQPYPDSYSQTTPTPKTSKKNAV